jgi:type I restriction enzyme S subunit
MNRWNKLKLGKILSKSSLLEVPLPGTTYKQIGVQLWGRGTYEREFIDGGDTGYKYFNKVKTNDVVINKIWARNGAVSVVPESMDSHYVSTEFPVFHIDQKILHPKWMLYVSQQKWFWEACNEKAFGTSGKNRIKPEIFLEIEIPIPPLSIQTELITRIDKVGQNLERIKQLRVAEAKDIKNLLYSKYSEIIEGADWYPMRIVAPIVRRDVVIDENALYPEVGIRSFGKGTFHKPALTGVEVGTKTLYQVKSGDLLFSNVFAWEGAIAVVKEEDDNRYGSHRFISCEVKSDQALAAFLCYHFLTPKGLEDINHASPGGAGRNKTLGLEKLMRINVPVPSLELQKEFVELLRKIEALREHHRQTEKELNELMPSLLDKAFKGEL